MAIHRDSLILFERQSGLRFSCVDFGWRIFLFGGFYMDEKDFLDELEQDMEYDPFTVMCGAVKFNDAHLFADAYTRFVKNQAPKDNKKSLPVREAVPIEKIMEQNPRKYKRLKKEIRMVIRLIRIYNYITEKLLHIR